MDNRRIFSFLADKQAQGKQCALVTVVSVAGSSMRNPGAHMGVAEDGNFEGSLSGGCIEKAVVAEALETLESCEPRITRFGEGSQYIDIRLPCGGGLDIHFLPLDGSTFANNYLKFIDKRQCFSLQLPVEHGEAEVASQWQPTSYATNAKQIVIGHIPNPRVLIIGHGATVESLARLAGTMDISVHVLTPDDRLLSVLNAQKISAEKLEATADTGRIVSDPWTAIVFLFHDHDWETQLMAHALNEPYFYIGAMGSQKAHAHRKEALISAGTDPMAIENIRAPVGLFHSSRDPDTLALSTLAEIVETYNQLDNHGIDE